MNIQITLNNLLLAVVMMSLMFVAGCGDGGGTPPVTTIPAAPVASAVGGTNQVTVSWAAVSGATSYNLYWSTTTGVTPATGTKIAGAVSPYVHSGLTAPTAYFYVVTAVNSKGESAPSGQVTATTIAPVIPAAPVASAVPAFSQVTVSWPAVSGATSYNIYWSLTTGVTPATGTKITGATSPYVHTGRAASTAYFYVVTAVNVAGESVPSAQVTATTPAAPVIPAAPTGVTATGGTNQVTVSWPLVSGATSYNVYWSLTTGVTPATGTKITGAVSPLVQTGLADSTAYFYVVTAVNTAGESAPSTQVTATTSAVVTPPALTTLTPSCVSACHGLPPTTVTGVAGLASNMPHTANTLCGVCHVIGGWVPGTTTFNMTGVATHNDGTTNILAGLPTPSCTNSCHAGTGTGLPPLIATHPSVVVRPYAINCGICHPVGSGNPFSMGGISTHDNGTIDFNP